MLYSTTMTNMIINQSDPVPDASPFTKSAMNRNEFTSQIRDHHRQLIAYAASIIGGSQNASDIVQEACVTAYKNLAKFESDKDFGAWMRGIVRNKCREFYRKQNTKPISDEAVEAIEQCHKNWEILQQEQSGVFGALRDCIDNLEASERSLIRSFYYSGESGDELAENLQVTPSAVRKRLQRSRTDLRHCLDHKTQP